MLRHDDTTLWWVQAVTGFALFFFASVHLYQMLMHPGDIGPYESADRVYSGRWWPLYFVLLFPSSFTAALAFIDSRSSGDGSKVRSQSYAHAAQAVKWAITVFFLTLGLLTFAAYMKVGYEHEHASASVTYRRISNQSSSRVRRSAGWEGRKSEL